MSGEDVKVAAKIVGRYEVGDKKLISFPMFLCFLGYFGAVS